VHDILGQLLTKSTALGNLAHHNYCKRGTFYASDYIAGGLHWYWYGIIIYDPAEVEVKSANITGPEIAGNEALVVWSG
jgi:hypothetical protein